MGVKMNLPWARDVFCTQHLERRVLGCKNTSQITIVAAGHFENPAPGGWYTSRNV